MEEEGENIPPTQDFFEQNFMTPQQGEKKREEPPRIERQRNPEPHNPSEELRETLAKAFRELNIGFVTLKQALRMSKTPADNQLFSEEFEKIQTHINSFVVTRKGGRRKTKKTKSKKGKRKN